MNYTVKQVSILLGITEEQVRRVIRSGKLNAKAHSKKEGYVIEQEDLCDFVINGDGKKYRDRVLVEQKVITGLTEVHYNIAFVTSLERLLKLRRQLAVVQQEIDKELDFLNSFTKKDS